MNSALHSAKLTLQQWTPTFNPQCTMTSINGFSFLSTLFFFCPGCEYCCSTSMKCVHKIQQLYWKWGQSSSCSFILPFIIRHTHGLKMTGRRWRFLHFPNVSFGFFVRMFVLHFLLTWKSRNPFSACIYKIKQNTECTNKKCMTKPLITCFA